MLVTKFRWYTDVPFTEFGLCSPRCVGVWLRTRISAPRLTVQAQRITGLTWARSYPSRFALAPSTCGANPLHASSKIPLPSLLPKADDSPLALTIAAFTPRFPTEPTYEPLEPRLIRANFRSTARRAGTERVRGAQAPECQQATPQELAILPSSNDPTSAIPVAHQCPVVRRKAYKLAMDRGKGVLWQYVHVSS